VNKAVFVTNSVKFLGLELESGRWSLARYLSTKANTFGELRSWKDLERMIGVVSYARRTIPDVERLLLPLRAALKEAKRVQKNVAWWKETDVLCKRMFAAAMN